MKRSIVKKAGTVLLSTATGLCCISIGISFGQDPASNRTEIQRRLANLFTRGGRSVPETAPQQRPNLRAAAPAAMPAVPSGITAPVTGSLPVVRSAKPVEAHPNPFLEANPLPQAKSFPNTEPWPSADPAPPVPAITPGPSSHPLASPMATEKAALGNTPVAHPLAETETPEPDSGFPEEFSLDNTVVPAGSSFEMPVFVEQTNAAQPAPQAAMSELEAEWQRRVQLELTTATTDQAPNSIPLAPPAVSEAADPFAELPMAPEAQPVTETAAHQEVPEQDPVPQVETKPATPTVEQASAQFAETQPIEKPAAPRGIGLGGCCPVTLRNDRIQFPGRAEHQSDWQGVVYRFASADAKQRFDANPEHYAPTHGGLDVTLTNHQGQEVSGTLEHAVWYRKQLYLFRDAQSLKTFTANPAKFVKSNHHPR